MDMFDEAEVHNATELNCYKIIIVCVFYSRGSNSNNSKIMNNATNIVWHQQQMDFIKMHFFVVVVAGELSACSNDDYE